MEWGIEEADVYLRAAATAQAGVWAVLPTLDFKSWWSPEVYEIFGRSPELGPLGAGEVFSVYHPDDARLIEQGWAVLASSDTPVRIRFRIFRPDGQMRHLMCKCRRAPPLATGERLVFGLVLDVTDLIDDAALVESERKFRFVAENTRDLILRLSPDDRVEFASKASLSMLGYAPEDLSTRCFGDLIHPEDREKRHALMAAAAATGRQARAEPCDFRVRRADGETLWLEGAARPVFDGDGRLMGHVDVVRDVTARKRLEAEVAEARLAAEQAARAKSEFLANMSHELRTPLTSIIGFGRALSRAGDLPEAAQGWADLIRTSAESLLLVVNDILDFSKLEAGGAVLESEPFDPAEAVENVAALMRDQALAKGVEVIVEAEAGPRLLGDVGRLRQILVNLVGNAVKFTPEGEVRVRLHCSAAAEPGRRLCVIEVEDTGIGIPADLREHIFGRFTQVDGSISRRFGGTGLGLSICDRLVRLMGGRIEVESGNGGSCFRVAVELPVADSETCDEPDPGPPAGPLGRLRLLAAEDHPAIRALLKLLLQDLDLDLVCDGVEAVEAAAVKPYDLILLDMQMPRMDGPTACRAIRALPGDAGRTPCLALTANVLPEQVEACRAAGMQGHIAKPIQVDALFAAIARHARAPCEAEAEAA